MSIKSNGRFDYRTVEQRDNLAKVIKGLRDLPAGYSNLKMDDFATNVDLSIKGEMSKEDCGCVIGHSPSFGVPFPNYCIYRTVGCMVGESIINVDWIRYSQDAFGWEVTELEWDFCFSSKWGNDVGQAIKRLELANSGGIPYDWGFNDTY